jgi:hypothetical protein
VSRAVKQQRLDTCRSCGETFTSIRAPNLRWPRTCSLPCRLAGLDRLIGALQARRAALAAELETDSSARWT